MAGPRTRQKLQPRSPQAIANAAKFGRGIGSFDIDQAWNQYGPGHGNLPKQYRGFEGNTFAPIHNLPFNVYRDTQNLEWVQEPMNKTIPGAKFYSGQPYGYFPPFVPESRTGNMGSILMNMEELRDKHGAIDFLGNMDQTFRAEENLVNDYRIGMEPNIFETPGRQMEGIPQDYPHIMDFYDYLNTLQAQGGNEMGGIESLVEAARRNEARNKKWWAQSDI